MNEPSFWGKQDVQRRLSKFVLTFFTISSVMTAGVISDGLWGVQAVSAAPLSIADAANLGKEQFWNFYNRDLGAGWNLSVNTGTGNLTVSDTLFRINGRGLPLTEMLSYNALSKQDTGVGAGWTLGSSMFVLENADGSVTLRDDNATNHLFTKNADGTYKAPAGTYMTLTKVSAGVFTIQEKDRSVYKYQNGLLQNITDPRGNVTTFTYGTKNQVSKITDPSNRALTYAYDANGRVSTITDPASHIYRFAYNATAGTLTSVTDPKGNITKFEYDANGRLSAFVDANTRRTTMTYDVGGRLAKVVDPRSTVANPLSTALSYDDATHTLTVTDPAGKASQYVHNAANNLTQLTNGASNVSSYTWDLNNMTQSVDAKGSTTYKYDAQGNVTEEKETISGTETSTTTTAFDSKDNPTDVTDANNNRSVTRYDSKSNDVSASNPARMESDAKTYDANGNVTSSTEVASSTYNMLQNGSFERFDANNNMLGWNIGSDPAAVTVDTANVNYGTKSLKINNATPTVNFVYSNALIVQPGQKLTLTSAGHLESVTKGAQIGIEFYDAAFNFLTSSYSDPSAGTGNFNDVVTTSVPASAAYAYVILELVDGTGTVWFDGVQLESPLKADEGHIVSEYDYVENSSFERSDAWTAGGTGSPSFTSETAYAGQWSGKILQAAVGTTYIGSYDVPMKAGEPLTLSGYIKTNNIVPSAAGYGANLEIDYYDAAGTYLGYANTTPTTGTQDFTKYSISITPPANTAKARVYGNVISSTGTAYFDSLKVTPRTTTLYGYDAGGNYMTASRDTYNNLTQYTYDAVGNKTSFTDARAYKTSFGYDADNNLTSVTDANAKLTYYSYDPVNKQVTVRDPRSASAADNTYRTQLSYNELNQVTSMTDALGKSTVSAYDNGGNKSSISYPTGKQVQFTYEGANRIASKTYAGDATAYNYVYDTIGNLSTVTDNQNRAYTYGYDSANRMNLITNALGYTLTHSYDKAGNVLSTTDSNGNSVSYTYGTDNRILTMTDPSGKQTIYHYDGSGRPFETIRGNGSKSFQIFDRLGRITQLADPGNPRGTSYYYAYDQNGNILYIDSTEGRSLYTYDALNRMTSWKDPSGTLTNYAYDAAGNLTQKGSRTFTYDAANQITNAGFTYDANGNMTSDGVNIYAYDHENHLLSVTKIADGSLVATYTYDYRGLRLSKTTAAGTIFYHWDDKNRLVRESDDSGNTIAAYYYTNTTLVAMEKSGMMYYVHTNHRGDITGLSDANQNQVANFDYDPWGNLIYQTGTVDLPFKYGGYYRDDETGLYYVKARYYSSDLGRFLTRDELELSELTEPQSLNQYAYVHGNPMKYVDPDGKYITWPGVFSVGISLSKLSFGNSGNTTWGHGSSFSTILYGTTVGSITQNVGRLVKAAQNSTGIFANPYSKASSYTPSYTPPSKPVYVPTPSYSAPKYSSYSYNTSYGSFYSSSYSSSKLSYTAKAFYGGSTRYSSFSYSYRRW
jgi:RHS repeat-associated protein